MKFLRVNNYNNIKRFKIFEKKLAFSNENNDLFLNNSFLANNNESFFFYSKYLCYHTEENETIFFDYEENSSFKIDVIFFETNLVENNFLTSKNIFRNEDGKWLSDLYLYQLFPFKELKKIEYFIQGGYLK